MNILHVSDSGLPDLRIERAALSAKKQAHNVYFAGLKKRQCFLSEKLFEKTFILPWRGASRFHLPLFSYLLSKKFKNVLSETQADIIHAHNIFSAKLASEFNVPFVFDDHEFLSKGSVARAESSFLTLRKKLSLKFASGLQYEWEREVASKTSIITVSNGIAREYRKIGASVFVVPNMPTIMETAGLPKVSSSTPISSSLSAVYVGNEATRSPLVFRDISETLRIFEEYDVGKLTIVGDNELSSNPPIYSTGFLPHDQMMKELTRHHIGLLTWKKHWYHKYCNPNKPYEYAHAGLFVISTSDLTSVIEALGTFCKPFDDYRELIEMLLYYKDNLRELTNRRAEIQRYAQENLIWEKNENQIFNAYKRALST